MAERVDLKIVRVGIENEDEPCRVSIRAEVDDLTQLRAIADKFRRSKERIPAQLLIGPPKKSPSRTTRPTPKNSNRSLSRAWPPCTTPAKSPATSSAVFRVVSWPGMGSRFPPVVSGREEYDIYGCGIHKTQRRTTQRGYVFDTSPARRNTRTCSLAAGRNDRLGTTESSPGIRVESIH